MTQKEKEDELIANFMGTRLPKSSYCDGNQWKLPFCEGFYPTLKTMRFRIDLGWIIHVVEKITKIRCAPDSDSDRDTFFLRTFGMLSPEGKVMVRINRHGVFEANTLLDALYAAVVDFIKNYNEYATSNSTTSREDSHIDGPRENSSDGPQGDSEASLATCKATTRHRERKYRRY